MTTKGSTVGWQRWRSLSERIDFWAETEAAAIRMAEGEDDEPLALAHFAEYVFAPHRDAARRYLA